MEAITVVGAGGIGCAVGWTLAGTGPVSFVDPDEDKLAWGTRHGVGVNHFLPRHATFQAFAGWRPMPGQVVLLCTKCYDNQAVLDRCPPGVHLVPIQNGFDPALETGPIRLEGIASFVSECTPGQTHTRITRKGELHLGIHRGGRATDGGAAQSPARLLHALANRLVGAPFSLRVVDDIRPYKYAKLMYNAAISPLAAAAGLDNGDLLRLPRARALFFALLRENHAILAHAGVSLGKVGPLHPRTVAGILRRPWLAHALAWLFIPGLRGSYCSMFADLPRGRTEIDYYNRHLLALAGEFPAPLNAGVLDLIHHMETQRIPPGPDALDSLLPVLEALADPLRESAAKLAGAR